MEDIIHRQDLEEIYPQKNLAKREQEILLYLEKVGLWAGYFFRIPDIRSISNAGYPVLSLISSQRQISCKLLDIRTDNRISGIRNQPYILYPDSFNIQYPAGY